MVINMLVCTVYPKRDTINKNKNNTIELKRRRQQQVLSYECLKWMNIAILSSCLNSP